ncbi:MAG: phosphate acyltransferase PlsX [Betaproteobacteria bacterium]|nr:MAG: phosphate acyltransferase PlsX [Betaproteobacteria bacterium]
MTEHGYSAAAAVRIAIDIDGGDLGADVSLPAAAAFLTTHSDAELVLVGLESSLSRAAQFIRAGLAVRTRHIVAAERVEMNESPALALKNKKQSSMRLSLNAVKDGAADACVSAGNTGALMATARFVLKTLPGIDRPAIASVMPTHSGDSAAGDGGAVMLDLGANAECTAEQLRQFAIMGSALSSALTQKARPTVALLNIGEEDMKGNELVKAAADLIRATDLNFIGNVEGTDIYKGKADVVVCDGFVGNIALKASEGAVKLMVQMLREELRATWWTKLLALVASPVLKRFKRRVDPARYNGATLLGLRGIVVKSHGGTNALGFQMAIERAYIEAKHNLIGELTDRVRAFAAASVTSEPAAAAISPTQVASI